MDSDIVGEPKWTYFLGLVMNILSFNNDYSRYIVYHNYYFTYDFT